MRGNKTHENTIVLHRLRYEQVAWVTWNRDWLAASGKECCGRILG